jgi:hypothetical protein
MSNKRYIEIYSSRRDRNKYPLISQFDIPLEQTGLKNTSETAYDPVIKSFPFYSFNLNTAQQVGSPAPSYPISPWTTAAFTGETFAGGSSASPQLNNMASSTEDNFYNGYHITDITISPSETRVITAFNTSTQTVTLNYPFSSAWAPTDSYIITDPSIPKCTTVTGTIAGTYINPVITITFVDPAAGPNYGTADFPDGYFQSNFLQILDGSGIIIEERVIDNFTNVGGSVYNICLDNAFTPSIFASAVSFRIMVAPLPYIHLQPNDIYNFKNPGLAGGFFTGDIVYYELTGEYHTIIAYDAKLRLAALDRGFTTFDPTLDLTVGKNGLFSLRKAPPMATGVFNANCTSTILYLDPTTSPAQNGALDGKYIYILPLGRCFRDIPTGKNVYRIKRYFGAVLPPDSPPGVTTYSVIIDGGINGIPIPLAGAEYEILVFSYDNFSPLSYNGSTVSQNQEVCYEITLLSLVLPNLILTSGSRISFYPYLYVEFGTLGTANNNSNQTIYSNNPPSNKALFITPITDISNPETTQFIKLDSSNMTQTVKFKPNDNLKFSVYLPNGELFLPVIQDDYSPLPPKPEIQIEAVFSIKRLV